MSLPSAQDGLKLPIDIWVTLFGSMDRPIWPLMCTCHFLYAAGMPHLLAFPIAISLAPYRRSPLPFCRFILADTKSRAGYLRDLRFFNTGEFGEEVMPSLAEVLRHASGLKMLTLSWLRHPLSAVERLIFRTLAQNESVQYLSLCTLNLEVVSELQRWRAPLSEVTVSSPTDRPDTNNLPSDITSALQTFSSTLRKLSVTGRQWTWTSNTGVVLPCLHSLTISHTTIDSPRSLARVFPNLKCLQIRDAPATGSDAESARQRNLSEMDPCWPFLERVEGRVDDVHALGLPCKVQHLKVTLYSFPNSARRLATLSSVAQPKRLELLVFWVAGAGGLEDLTSIVTSTRQYLTDLKIVCTEPGSGQEVYISRFFVRALYSDSLVDGLLTPCHTPRLGYSRLPVTGA